MENNGNNLYERWNKPKYIMASMINQSDLPFRMLSRKYGCELCYTSMLHSKWIVDDKYYWENNFQTNKYDRPLIIQLGGNNSKTLIKASNLLKDKCDAIDINIGINLECPNFIENKGKYNDFLFENEDLAIKMVEELVLNVKIPITCKIRIFPDKERTINLAKNWEKAGCSILTVHGRTKEQNLHLSGKCNWDIIKEIKENLKIPVISNGGIQKYEDIKYCLEYTKVDGVMSAEALLENPALFSEELKDLDDLAMEYWEYFNKYPENKNSIKPHLFKILYKGLKNNFDWKKKLFKSNDLNSIKNVILELKERRKNIKWEEKFGWYERYNKSNKNSQK